MEKSKMMRKMNQSSVKQVLELNGGIQEEINVEIGLIKSQFTYFDENCTWILERRAANDVVSVRAFRHRLCGSLTSRRARRTVARIISDPSIMSHVYIPEPED